MDSAENFNGESHSKALLELRNISKLYPGTVALNNVNIDIESGECHGIIGKNGAGKTTLVKIMSGVISPSKGQIFINGKLCNRLTRRQAKKLGISIVTQEPQVIPEFSVAENLLFPDYPSIVGNKVNWDEIYEKAKAVLTQAGLPLDLKCIGADLSVSEQQLLLVIKAFFVDLNDIVILDEVTTALSRRDQEYLYELIDHQKQKGKAILFISHRMSEIIRICDRITVLRDAKKIASRQKKGLNENDLSSLIIGEDYDKKSAMHEAPVNNIPSQKILGVEKLTIAGMFSNISLTLNKGEVVGLAGLRGSGRTDLMKTIAGIYQRDRGRILLDGKEVKFNSPSIALRSGVAYLPEDRDNEGLVEILSVKSNITLSSLYKFTKKFIIKFRKEARESKKLIDELDIKVSTHDQEVKTLSGGNRQKVVIARLMAAEPKVFLLDEPTKGIDIGAKNAILNSIRTELTKTSGILMTSPSVEDLMMVCDRIIVLYNGRLVAEYKREEFDINIIYLTIQGVGQNKKENSYEQKNRGAKED